MACEDIPSGLKDYHLCIGILVAGGILQRDLRRTGCKQSIQQRAVPGKQVYVR